jgi:PBSX family phage terminase large subunit
VVQQLKTEYAGTIYYDRFINGLWVAATGLVYPLYDTAIEEVPDGEPSKYVLSVDYGTQNAFSAGLWGLYERGWWRVKEYYYSGRTEGIQKTDEEYAQDLDRFTDGIADSYNKLRVIIDPSAASFIALLRKRGKYHVIQADNAVLDGIRETATAMQSGRFKVSPVCKNWIKEASGYVWDDSAVDDRPVKINDHAMDETRYFVKTMNISKQKSIYKSVMLGGF